MVLEPVVVPTIFLHATLDPKANADCDAVPTTQ
jgi:hypothetical protein